ncbi:MAG: hypothetical protein ACE5HI_02590 [bacterium]
MSMDIKEVHLFIENGGDDSLVSEVMKALHPELLGVPGLKIVRHDVEGWVSDPFAYAYTKLALSGIRLTETNCLTGEGEAYGKRIYRVLLKR